MNNIVKFGKTSISLLLQGGKLYWTWIGCLLVVLLWGLAAYIGQLQNGLIMTNMRDSVSWGYYIGNFTFLVGIAAAAVMLVIPAYVYNWGPIKEIVLLGEILAISALIMCMLFVTVDIGQPMRALHLMPFVGKPNFPISLLSWDVFVLSMYLVINLTAVGYTLYMFHTGRHYNKKLLLPLVLFSIPAAISIHTVTAFLYAGAASRPFWNASILAPRFIASAFCSGPALILILFQVLRKITTLKIKDAVLHKVSEVMTYCMFINLFLLGAELFKEYYSGTEHTIFMNVLFFGVGKTEVHYFMWPAVIANVTAFLIFLNPKTRNNFKTMNIACVLTFLGVYTEKGMGMVIPGFTPDTLGEIYIYSPSMTEYRVGFGVVAIGCLVFTLLVKLAMPYVKGEIEHTNHH